MGYRIKTVAELLGVPRNTLLAWERRYNIVHPPRRENGYREYSESDIHRLRELKRLIDNGYRVGEAISLMQDVRTGASAPAEGQVDAMADVCEDLLDALLRLDRRGAEEILQHRCVSLSFDRLIDQVYFPLLRHVGDLWAEDALSVAQEHLVSQFCRERLQGMLIGLDHGPLLGRLTVCAAYPEEQHDLPLLGLAVKLALRNHRIIYLGARVPTAALCDLIREHRPALVCISLTMPRPAEEIVSVAAQLADAAIAEVVIGGAGLPADLSTLPRVRWAYRTRDLLPS